MTSWRGPLYAILFPIHVFAQDLAIGIDVPEGVHGAVYTENGVLGTVPFSGHIDREKVGRIFAVTDVLPFLELDVAKILTPGIYLMVPPRTTFKLSPDSIEPFRLGELRIPKNNGASSNDNAFDLDPMMEACRSFLEQKGFDTNDSRTRLELVPNYLETYNLFETVLDGPGATLQNYSVVQSVRWSLVNRRSGKEVFSKEVHGGHWIGTLRLYGKDSERSNREEEIYASKKAFVSSLERLLADSTFAVALRKWPSTRPEENSSVLTMSEPGADFASTVQQCLPSTVTLRTTSGFGSGFFISSSGYLLTNDHVLEPGDSVITVVLNNGFSLEASVVRRRAEADVALLKVKGIHVIPLRCDHMPRPVGTEVYAIGTPEHTDLSQTLTKGIISGNRNLDGRSYIQSDVAINRGNSGGPLVDTKGTVIGIVTAKLIGTGTESLGFAIPIADAFRALEIE